MRVLTPGLKLSQRRRLSRTLIELVVTSNEFVCISHSLRAAQIHSWAYSHIEHGSRGIGTPWWDLANRGVGFPTPDSPASPMSGTP
jgi:hypothetical protein